MKRSEGLKVQASTPNAFDATGGVKLVKTDFSYALEINKAAGFLAAGDKADDIATLESQGL